MYRGFDAATAKPSREDRARIPHHLVDVADPRDDYDLGVFVRAADRAIAEIVERGRVPVVVGGTGMYLRGLLRGVVAVPPRDRERRRRLRGIVERGGTARLHRLLLRLDPGSAERVAPTDIQRLVRALEIALGPGPRWSERLLAEGRWDRENERFAALKFVVEMERAAHRRRLDDRVDRFFEDGLAEEVRALLAAGVPESANAFKGIGYREVLAAISAGRDPDAVRDEVKRSTWRYAKRQRTWFRAEPGMIRLDAALGGARLAEIVVETWRRRRGGG